jgi:carbonic anhydrase
MCHDTRAAHPPVAPILNRRGMLRLAALSGAAAFGAGVALPAEVEAAPWEQEPIDTPAKALDALKRGNARFVERGMTTPQRNLQCTPIGPPTQTPFAAILSCADSRVPVELLFDQGFGNLFVCRSAGNITTAELIGSLEYGVVEVKVKAVVVLGHNDCGAVKATMDAAAAPGQITSLYAHIYPAVARSDGSWASAIVENVKEQVMLLRRASTVIREREPRSVMVVGATYDLCSGQVQWL